MKSFFNETLKLFLQKVLDLLNFRSCENCMSSAYLVAEIQFNLFVPNAPFLYPLKHQKTLWFSDVLRR